MFELLAQEGSGASPFGGLLFIVPMIAIFYFLLIRPQQRRMKEQRDLLGQLEVGDEVVTAGGIFGTITAIDEDDDVLSVEIAPGTTIRMLRGGISRRLVDEDEPYDEDDQEDDEEADRSS